MTATWTAPRTWANNELVSDSLLNTHLRDNLDWFYARRLDVLHYEDQKASGTAPAAIAAGAWRTRELNTEVIDTGNFGTLGTNQVSLASGIYLAWFNCPVGSGAQNRARLRNVTDGVTLATSPGGYAGHTGFGRFVLAATKSLELQHWIPAGANGGTAMTSGESEIYAQLVLLRLGD